MTNKPLLMTLLVSLAAGCSQLPVGDEGEYGIDQASLQILVKLPTALGAATVVTHRPSRAMPVIKRTFGFRRVPTKTAPKPLAPHTMETEVDLSTWAVPVGDQGQYGSCASWSSGYSAMGWWLNRTKMDGNPLNPIFLYTMVEKGPVNKCAADNGSMLEDVLELMQKKGVAPESDYPNTECKNPSGAALKAAEQYRISGFHTLDLKDPVEELKMALSSKRPVTLGLMLTNEFMNADSTNFFIGDPNNEDTDAAHAIAAMGYDEKGVWIQNSWSEKWGKDGWAQVSWEYIGGSCGKAGACLMSAAMIDGIEASPGFDPETAP